jgi:thiosulfate reductase cytochrome b subunit
MAIPIARSGSTTTKITHWAVVVSSALLFATGAAIYNRRPRFRFGHQALTLPRVPSWLTMTYEPRLIHYVFAAVFVLCGIAYLAWGLRGGYFRDLAMSRADVAKLIPMQLYYLRLRRNPPEYGAYNPLQKLAYFVVLFVAAPLLVLSGAALLEFPIFRPLAAIFVGGVKLWHVALTAALCLFVIGHVGMVLTTGFGKNMRKMM